MDLKFLNKLKETNKITKVVWSLLILFFVGMLIAYLTGYINQVTVIAGNVSFLILAVLLFVLVLVVLLGILGIKLKK